MRNIHCLEMEQASKKGNNGDRGTHKYIIQGKSSIPRSKFQFKKEILFQIRSRYARYEFMHVR